jgi:hypothetical protein
MAQYIEDFVPVVKYNDFNTQKPATFESTMAVTGVATFAAATAFSGATTGLRRTAEIQLTGTGDTLLAAESGATIIATKASATQTFVLPSAATAGLYFTFICGSASGEILIDPAGSESIITKAANNAGASVAPAGGTGIKNTAATNVLNDYLTLVSDGVDTWYTVAQSGIWASQ